ncbi:hypothetical protein [Tenacibaculum soleae]|uniref:hypothetical protein n=1 Tax=Tenacibaculum soleae TaxID=447689 RepID=UPI002300659A|nr:hypothetical protein [Tenacibaculum soleae]
MQEEYNNYEEPITSMRKLSEVGVPFAFSHKKQDGTTVIVRKATLRPQSRNEFDTKSKYKLQYTNLETKEKRSCYIPLLLSFNDKLIDVSK